MSKKIIYDYLDNPNQVLEEDELLSILQEVESLEDPSPGEAYWQNFNSRLETRLHEAKATTALPWWRRFTLPLGFAVTFAAVLVWFMLPQQVEEPGLEQFTDDQLQLIAQVYVPLEDEDVDLELGTSEHLDLLLDVLSDDGDDYDIYEDPSTLPDAETLKDLWNLEG